MKFITIFVVISIITSKMTHFSYTKYQKLPFIFFSKMKSWISENYPLIFLRVDTY